MNKDKKYHKFYMDLAIRSSLMSHCLRKKVGAVAVNKEETFVVTAWNGTPAGMDNCCEDINNKTHQHVLHAEQNLIRKFASTHESLQDCTVYVTLLPCIDCAKLMCASGVSRVIYLDEYRSSDGHKLMAKMGIECVKYSDLVDCNQLYES